MRKFTLAVILICISALLLSACGGKTADPASKAVEDYLNALVAKDSTKLSALSCKDWESNALMELDSLQAVKTRLDGLTCKSAGANGTTTLVNCQGKFWPLIMAKTRHWISPRVLSSSATGWGIPGVWL